MEFLGQGETNAAFQSTQPTCHRLHAQLNESGADYKTHSLSSVKGKLCKISNKLTAVSVVANVTVTQSE
jgi:hypothetical protein